MLKINIDNKTKTSFIILNGQKYLLFELNGSKSYFRLPAGVNCSKFTSELHFFNCCSQACLTIKTWFKQFDKRHIKKLILNGLGLKASIQDKHIELKLGFSHVIKISIPESIKISINKRVLIFEGFNLVELGNFTFKIRSLKFPNIYKGKGIWYKNEQLTLKTIKKKK